MAMSALVVSVLQIQRQTELLRDKNPKICSQHSDQITSNFIQLKGNFLSTPSKQSVCSASKSLFNRHPPMGVYNFIILL